LGFTITPSNFHLAILKILGYPRLESVVVSAGVKKSIHLQHHVNQSHRSFRA
jgi:hypothetical protein